MLKIAAHTTRLSFKVILVLFVVFILPALVHLGVWALSDRPTNWRSAQWSSAGILPANPSKNDAAVYVFNARTGGLKGAFATHSWLVLKPHGANYYDRYDVVGWGTPLRKNAYDADGHWYSNQPVISHQITGEKAMKTIPALEKAIANYRWRDRGDYTLWPGPNSNTFVASILAQFPELSANAPSTAVGRDFPADGKWIGRRKDGAFYATAGGYFGIEIGGDVGFEVNFLGLVAGLNPTKGELIIPAFGAISWRS
jgi:hypothetical protein